MVLEEGSRADSLAAELVEALRLKNPDISTGEILRIITEYSSRAGVRMAPRDFEIVEKLNRRLCSYGIFTYDSVNRRLDMERDSVKAVILSPIPARVFELLITNPERPIPPSWFFDVMAPGKTRTGNLTQIRMNINRIRTAIGDRFYDNAWDWVQQHRSGFMLMERASFDSIRSRTLRGF